ncbi:MAG: CoA pyrophosphatase [Bacteroidetes bacterium]|nr:CoA pyrophosphatase [Bacteroidota bacterium]MBS1740027.1 CoA pyrophosphatase [Bacteroidota bacterium]MBS1777521.1 CoA pyrophosphatase [Bacteroidota bacterium]
MDLQALSQWLFLRLKQTLPGKDAHQRMFASVREYPQKIPADVRSSAVLSLLFPKNGELNVLLIKRVEDGHAHSGQISFPGGRQEPFDADLRATALREAQEEVGIVSSKVTIIGALTELYIPVSNFLVHPFLAFSEVEPQFNISHEEVDYPIEWPLKELLDKEHKTIARVTSAADASFSRSVNAYRTTNNLIIWGATAMMLSELEVLLEEFNTNK